MTLSTDKPIRAETDVAFPNLDDDRGAVRLVGGSRDIGDEALRLRLEGFLSAHPHLNTKILGRSDHTGVSRSGLDAYLKGTYFLRKEDGGMGVSPTRSDTENKIRSYLDRAEGSSNNGVTTAFTHTVLWKQFQYACNTAITENIIVLAYGAPGHGKSRSLLQYQMDKLTTRPIEILCSPNITTRYFLQKIAREMRISDRGIIPELEDQIAEKLIKNKRAIVVDQANYLNEKSLGSVCYLWERARIGIVLIGTHDLKDLFTSLKGKEDVKAQLSSRVALMVPLMGLSTDEAKTIITNALGRFATSEVIAQIYEATGGSYRHISFLLPRLAKSFDRNSQEIDNGTVKVEAVIADATLKLLID